MNYSIPGWELSCAGAVAASTMLDVPEVLGPPRLSLHPSALRMHIFLSIALPLSAPAELTSEQALA